MNIPETHETSVTVANEVWFLCCEVNSSDFL